MESYKYSILDLFFRHRCQAYILRNIEEIISLAHCICMVYCIVADIKVSMDDSPYKTLTYKKPYEFYLDFILTYE